MYAYLYDAYVRSSKYDRVLAKIESRLYALGLQGKTEKLTILKSMKELVESVVRRGADTVVAVGNDATLNKMVNLLLHRDVLLGYIPVDGENPVARGLGIPHELGACDVLSTRIVQRLDVGCANTTYFLSHLALEPSDELVIEGNDGKFVIEPDRGLHTVTLYNFGLQGSDPRDGKLELTLVPSSTSGKKNIFGKKGSTPSVLPIKTARIQCLARSVAAYADGQTVVKTPIMISVEPRALRMIVGKGRSFANL